MKIPERKKALLFEAPLYEIKKLYRIVLCVFLLGRIIKRFHEFNLVGIFDKSKYSMLRRSDQSGRKSCKVVGERKLRDTFY